MAKLEGAYELIRVTDEIWSLVPSQAVGVANSRLAFVLKGHRMGIRETGTGKGPYQLMY